MAPLGTPSPGPLLGSVVFGHVGVGAVHQSGHRVEAVVVQGDQQRLLDQTVALVGCDPSVVADLRDRRCPSVVPSLSSSVPAVSTPKGEGSRRRVLTILTFYLWDNGFYLWDNGDTAGQRADSDGRASRAPGLLPTPR